MGKKENSSHHYCEEIIPMHDVAILPARFKINPTIPTIAAAPTDAPIPLLVALMPTPTPMIPVSRETPTRILVAKRIIEGILSPMNIYTTRHMADKADIIQANVIKALAAKY
jgi:hypothetical protein